MNAAAGNAQMPARPVRVLVVDASPNVRQQLARVLNQDPEILVIGAAADPYAARDLIVELEPDVVTLDLEMPRMDAATFLRQVMKHRPLPVIGVSAPGSDDRWAADALAAGAVDVVRRPAADQPRGAANAGAPAVGQTLAE